ncbi:MAG: response regulator [Burkholderiales bacterium]|nr:response regulator [Burkholderiales bacterium]
MNPVANGADVAPNILVASDNSADAALVRSLLANDFSNVYTSTDPNKAIEEFDRRAPQVLVLAFNVLEKAERHCLALYRLSTKIQSHPHRTVILCDKEQVKDVAELCIKQSFDDYVLFWPMNHDAPRLRMAVHHALRELASANRSGPSLAEFAAQARRLAELDSLLDRQMALGGRRIEGANLAIEQAEAHIGRALDGFSRRLGEGELPEVVDVKDASGLDRAVSDLKRDGIQPPLRAAAESMQPLRRWADELRRECAPHLESARAMGEMASRLQPTVLVVDDDELQHKMVATLLAEENCHLVFATTGSRALKIIGKSLPDLILMDVQMPGMDGIEVLRRLKAAPHLASVPVIMITGKSAGTVVVDCLKAGAADFIVKPFDRHTLISKVARWSRPVAPRSGSA